MQTAHHFPKQPPIATTNIFPRRIPAFTNNSRRMHRTQDRADIDYIQLYQFPVPGFNPKHLGEYGVAARIAHRTTLPTPNTGSHGPHRALFCNPDRRSHPHRGCRGVGTIPSAGLKVARSVKMMRSKRNELEAHASDFRDSRSNGMASKNRHVPSCIRARDFTFKVPRNTSIEASVCNIVCSPTLRVGAYLGSQCSKRPGARVMVHAGG
ncbi:hypothetical protein IQ06DRAFT_309424 [Phaeosphaeriaceae sp. SRC1lsM3a]|nr:hypothetical protein IQ06DRAFT_309424 [Stagonospora sp. SRC1lsM3a]